jgi:hypothetical protein
MNYLPSPMRFFSTSMNQKFVKMEDQQFHRDLIEKQRQFDSNHLNPKYAYKYLRELNRHQKYQTVIRLYEKYETDYRTHQDHAMQDKVRD